jgi:hypothetical protein
LFFSPSESGLVLDERLVSKGSIYVSSAFCKLSCVPESSF